MKKTKTFYEKLLDCDLHDGDINSIAHSEDTRAMFTNSINRIFEEKRDFDRILTYLCNKFNTQRDNDYWKQEDIRTASAWLLEQQDKHPDYLWEVYFDRLNKDFTQQILLISAYNSGSFKYDPFYPAGVLKLLGALSSSKDFIQCMRKETRDGWLGPQPAIFQEYFEFNLDEKADLLRNACLDYMDSISINNPSDYIFDSHTPKHNSYDTGEIGMFMDFIDVSKHKPWESLTSKQQSILFQGYLCAYTMLKEPIVSDYGFNMNPPQVDLFKEKYDLNYETIGLKEFLYVIYKDNLSTLKDKIDVLAVKYDLTDKLPTFKEVYDVLSSSLTLAIESKPLDFDL